MRLTALGVLYFFFGFGASKGGFFNDFGSVFSTCGCMGELVAFGEASLNLIDITLPRDLPLIYLFIVFPCRFFSSMMVSSESRNRYLERSCVPPYEFNYLTIKYRY